jgi:sugar/nucleoside kinase (ribokinase family)
MRARLAALAILLCTTAPLTACIAVATGSSFLDARRFSPRPDQRSAVEPVAKVNERLSGFYYFGFVGTEIEPERLREEYLSNRNARISNWQTVTGTGMTPLAFIFTTPYAEVVFDVVEVE